MTFPHRFLLEYNYLFAHYQENAIGQRIPRTYYENKVDTTKKAVPIAFIPQPGRIGDIDKTNPLNSLLDSGIRSTGLGTKRAAASRIREYLNDNTIVYYLNATRYAYSYCATSARMLSIIASAGLNTIKFSCAQNSFICARGFLSQTTALPSQTLSQRVLIAMVLKPGRYREYKVRSLLGEPMPNDMFELWVNPAMKRDFKYLWRMLNKGYIANVRQKRIAVVEKENINDLIFAKIEIPNFKTLIDRKKWLEEKAKTFLQVFRPSETESEQPGTGGQAFSFSSADIFGEQPPEEEYDEQEHDDEEDMYEDRVDERYEEERAEEEEELRELEAISAEDMLARAEEMFNTVDSEELPF